MPYVKQSTRKLIDPLLGDLVTFVGNDIDEGNLNYILTTLIKGWNPESYSDYNTLIGVLECAKLELYRRRVAGYEDTKLEANGDVYL